VAVPVEEHLVKMSFKYIETWEKNYTTKNVNMDSMARRKLRKTIKDVIAPI